MVRDDGCPVAWTEHNGGHWIVSNYELVAAAFRDWERFSSERIHPEQNRDRVQQQQAPAVPPGRERPAATGTATAGRSRRSSHPRHRSVCARGPASGPRTHLDQVVERGECEFVHDLTCPVPAAVTLEWLGYPQRGVADVLRRLPRRLRVSRRFARAPEGLGGVRPGAGPHRRRAARPDRVAARRRSHRDRAPRGRRRAAPRRHRAVDRVPHDGRRHRHDDLVRRRRAAASRRSTRPIVSG